MAKDSEMTKLQGDNNYGAWELRARVAARSAGLLDTILGIDEQPTTGPNSKLYKAWKNRRDAATELIVKRMEDTTLTHVRGYEENPAGFSYYVSVVFEDKGREDEVEKKREGQKSVLVSPNPDNGEGSWSKFHAGGDSETDDKK
ncbi:hypothetical protein K435DRAFT_965539 [Dendrothele bispora CBS 962.96]|uniref:DUF4219 domain-containing protein n=1 Tax=Dendrothele bispora (strain CBS 962.96) TaxID=1314807 RepID=A0A4S8M519_DENBC|nr:hypothetical protein K435DRAFT_965539 [Dendrothele bispora CBS 962.96]